MRTRALAGVVVAAWAKTAVVAPAALANGTPTTTERWLPEVPTTVTSPPDTTPPVTTPPVTTPPANPWSNCSRQYMPYRPWLDGAGRVETYAKGYSAQCPSGTLELRASADGSHWKTLESTHVTMSDSMRTTTLTHSCLPGTWTYQAVYNSDDGKYKGLDSNTIAC